MDYDSNTAFKRSMVDVAGFGLGCVAGASAIPAIPAALVTIGAGVLIGILIDMYKKNISN